MTSSETVCAVIYGQSPGPLWQGVAGAIAKPGAPAFVLVAQAALDLVPAGAGATGSVAAFTPAAGESPFAGAVRAAASTGSRWIWLLDGWTVPEPDALRGLLSAGDAVAAPAPLLLASKVLDQGGRLHPDAIPRHEIFEKERSVAAAERHLVQLRAAAHGSVLVAAAAVERFGLPRSDLPVGLDMHEWSARLLRSWEDTGYLVPASVATRWAQPVAHPWRHWVARAQVVGSSAWTPTEKLWEAFLLGEAVAERIRVPRAQGRSGVGAPGASPSRTPRTMIGITRTAQRLKRR